MRPSGVRPSRVRLSSTWLLALLALTLAVMVAMGSPWWPPMLSLVAGLGLVYLRPPWSVLLYLACVLTGIAQALS